MSRPPSESTQLKTARRMLGAAQAECRSLKQQRDTYQARFIEARNEVVEWKRRFDALLKILPEQSSGDVER